LATKLLHALRTFFPNYIMVYFIQKVLNSKLTSLKK